MDRWTYWLKTSLWISSHNSQKPHPDATQRSLPAGLNPCFSSSVHSVHPHGCRLHFNTAAIELAQSRLHQILSGGVEIQSHSSPWRCLLRLWCTAKKTFLTLILRWLENRGGHNHSAWHNQNDTGTQKLSYFLYLITSSFCILNTSTF